MNRQNRNDKKAPNWIGLAVVLLLTAPEFVISIGIFAGIIYLVIKLVKNSPSTPKSQKITYTRKPEALDECPKPLFCFHNDKGEHHVSRGKEIDPWDRPDIDISKYQRRG